MNVYHTYWYCFYCWLWACICLLGLNFTKYYTWNSLKLNSYWFPKWADPANIYLFKLNNWITRKRCEIEFKKKKRKNRATSFTSFSWFYCYLWTYFTPFSSIADLCFIVCTPPLSAGGLSLQPNFQKGVLERTSIFRGGLLGKWGGDVFQGGGGVAIVT